MTKEGKYLITGGTGYLGQALIEQLIIGGYENLRVVSRNEGLLVNLQEKYSNIEIITGDIASKFICEKACMGVNGIFHLAAFKHVGLAEKQVRECVFSNVMGSMNLLDMTLKYKPEFIIGISTDKAARINGVYGATKMLMEKLFTECEEINKETKYRMVRYGNVIYSTGSVLCKWKKRLEEGTEVVVTNVDATRFYWTVDEAIELIFSCLEGSEDSRPLSAPMKAIRVGDLLRAMVEKYNPPGIAPQIKHIGLQEGENMHEIITAEGKSSKDADKYTHEEIMELI